MACRKGGPSGDGHPRCLECSDKHPQRVTHVRIAGREPRTGCLACRRRAHGHHYAEAAATASRYCRQVGDRGDGSGTNERRTEWATGRVSAAATSLTVAVERMNASRIGRGKHPFSLPGIVNFLLSLQPHEGYIGQYLDFAISLCSCCGRIHHKCIFVIL